MRLRLIDEKERVWHAGVNAWAGRTNLIFDTTGVNYEVIKSSRQKK